MMVAYSFKDQFRAPILSGAKRQTIRAERKRHARPGEEIQLYVGMRTPACALIGRALCASVGPIRINVDSCWVHVDGVAKLTQNRLDDFARTDGFADWDAMREFWLSEHPGVPTFSGALIRWEGLLP